MDLQYLSKLPFNGHLNVVKSLLAVEGIDICTKNDGGYTALMGACIKGYVDIVKALLEALPQENF
jgi:ankyrin repeat protein